MTQYYIKINEIRRFTIQNKPVTEINVNLDSDNGFFRIKTNCKTKISYLYEYACKKLYSYFNIYCRKFVYYENSDTGL